MEDQKPEGRTVLKLTEMEMALRFPNENLLIKQTTERRSFAVRSSVMCCTMLHNLRLSEAETEECRFKKYFTVAVSKQEKCRLLEYTFSTSPEMTTLGNLL
jgi:hypothetical protein